MYYLSIDTRLRRRRQQPGDHPRESIRDLGYEQLLRQPRSLLDGGIENPSPDVG
jgi:hypothetical protein